MAKQIEGVSERIQAAAQAEFPDKGYMKASLRAIAAAADTSTNSIYVCFGDKEGLFSAIAEPVLSGMTERFLKLQEAFHRLDAFRLLPDASPGTRYRRFEDELVRIEAEYTYKYVEAAGCPARLGDALTEKLLRVVTASRFESIFAVIRHSMSRAEAHEYIKLLSRCRRTGFRAVFGSRTEARQAAGNGSFPSDHQLAKPNSRGRTPLWRNRVPSGRAAMRSSSHSPASTPTSWAASGRPPAGSSEPPTPENERAPPAAGGSGRRGRFPLGFS